MGGVVKSITKPFKSVTKTVSNVVKKTAKAITKVGKSVMKGVAKISNKLGPVGMIALSIAMPYALAGLSSITTAAMALSTFNTFLQAVGQVGKIYEQVIIAFNAGVSNAFSSITKLLVKHLLNLLLKVLKICIVQFQVVLKIYILLLKKQ
jgi:predicted DNA repair protein MutK